MNLGIFNYIKTLSKYGYKNGNSGETKYHPVISLGTENVFDSYWDFFVVNGRFFIVAIMGSDNILNGANVELVYINPNSISSVHCPVELDADVSKAESVTAVDFASDIVDLIKNTVNGSENFDIPYSSLKMYLSGQIIYGNNTLKSDASNANFQVDNEVINIAKVVDYDNTTGQTYETRRIIAPFAKLDAISIPFVHLPQTPFKDIVGDKIKQLCANYLSSKDILHGRKWMRNTGFAQGERVWVKDPSDNVKKFFASKEYENNVNPLEDTSGEHWVQFEYN